jgi:unsaturated rhamnogalacturonyl hydrolase
MLKGFEQVWLETKDRKYFDYMKQIIDGLVDADGNIKGYKFADYNLDEINSGKILFPLYAEATDPKEKERYKKAAFLLRSQIKAQPRTSEGGFWHKNKYPHQMWLDGVYMASPFLAQFAVVFNEPALLDEVAKQIILAEKHTRDRKTGLLYHAWDESKQQRWADPKTGKSPHFWGRAMGWYAMAIVDVLDHLPKNHSRRAAVEGVLRRLAASVASVQDKTSGVWWQVLDAGSREKNYREASASSMFTYALEKGVRNGWLERKKYGDVAARGYQGILTEFVETDDRGQVTLKSICKVAGLGGEPYRDGSYQYYTTTDVVANDPKGVGAFILASAERERGPQTSRISIGSNRGASK